MDVRMDLNNLFDFILIGASKFKKPAEINTRARQSQYATIELD